MDKLDKKKKYVKKIFQSCKHQYGGRLKNICDVLSFG